MRCEDCCHAEMCKWIDELGGRGCDFLSQEPISLNDINNALGASFRNGVRSAKVEQEPRDDAIDREYLFKVLDDFCGHDRTATITLDTLADLVYELPSVTHKSGKWHIAHGLYEDRFWCSCGYIRIMDSRMNEWKYCPVCGGAKMVEPQESEEISERNMKMWEEIFKAKRSDEE